MSENEMRELDEWIAVEVFCWQEFREEEFPHRYLWREGEAGSRIWDKPHRYTEDTHFHELLEKCAEKSEACVCVWHSVGGFTVGTYDHEIAASGETLPLALAKFAEKLFGQ